jgi:CheY-like chemotaxis protein
MTRILLIDDEAWFRAPAALMLRRDGYHVDCATDAEEALRLLESIHPDLILLDLMMPGMGGLNFLRRLRADERFAAMPVVVLSAWADGEPGTEALALGAKACLLKGSFSLVDLTYQLEKLAPAA